MDTRTHQPMLAQLSTQDVGLVILAVIAVLVGTVLVAAAVGGLMGGTRLTGKE